MVRRYLSHYWEKFTEESVIFGAKFLPSSWRDKIVRRHWHNSREHPRVTWSLNGISSTSSAITTANPLRYNQDSLCVALQTELTISNANQCGCNGICISTTTSVIERWYSPMQEPWTSVVSLKPYCHIVDFCAFGIAADTHDISTNRIDIVIRAGSCTSHDIKGVLGEKLDTLLLQLCERLTPWKWKGCCKEVSLCCRWEGTTRYTHWATWSAVGRNRDFDHLVPR